MYKKVEKIHRRVLPGIFFGLVFLFAAPAWADDPEPEPLDYEWVGGSGSVTTLSNWLVDGSTPEDPPGALDSIIFDTGATTAYTVTFATGETNYDGFFIRNDTVNFSLASGSSVETPSSSGSFRIAGNTGEDSTVSFAGGGEYVLRVFSAGAGNGTVSDITITGAGTLVQSINNHPILASGTNSVVTMTISDGAQFDTNQFFYMGRGNRTDPEVTAPNTITVTGVGSSWTHNHNRVARVGDEGGSENIVYVQEGALVSVSNLRLGNTSTGIGRMEVSGVGVGDVASTFSGSGYTDVGFSGEGSILVEAGGSFSSREANIAANAGSIGVVDVRGEGSVWNSQRWFTVGGDTDEVGGTGTAWLRDNAVMNIATNNDVNHLLRVMSTGTFNLDGATLNVQGGGILVLEGGLFRGHGSVVGNAVSEGTVQLGTYSGDIFDPTASGTLSLEGNLDVGATSQLGFSITDATDHDILAVNGNLSISGATLQLFFSQAINLLENPVEILTWTGTGSVSFSDIQVSGVAHDVELLVGDNSITVIPEPTTAVLFGGGAMLLVFLWVRQRRCRQA